MAIGRNNLLALLESDEDLSTSFYENVVEAVTKYPQQISDLARNYNVDSIVLLLATRSTRLALVLDRVHAFQCQHPKSLTTMRCAAATTDLLVQITTSLHEILEIHALLDLLVPALRTCLVSPLPNLRKLARTISEPDKLLEHLVSHPDGAKIIKQWTISSNRSIEDAAALRAWTAKLAGLASSCPGGHSVVREVQQWTSLQSLSQTLLELEHEQSARSQSQLSSLEPPWSSMTLLGKDNKKEGLPKRTSSNVPFPSIANDVVSLLEDFELPIPASSRMLRIIIEALETEKTLTVLRDIARSFPCKLCSTMLHSSTTLPTKVGIATNDHDVRAPSDLNLDILGKLIGEWKILLSIEALKNMQNISRSGFFGSVRERLADLASGNWRCRTDMGSEKQRKALKVPLATTKCKKDLYILWQVDIGPDGHMPNSQQVLKIWGVISNDEMPDAIDRIVTLQRSYTHEVVRRSRQLPAIVGNKCVPLRFSDHLSQPACFSEPKTGLDVRTIDHRTIDMSNKFYALTEPMIRSILTNDLAAEFPFDLSKDEAKVIRHFQTASLILGRSGTGKTTCLVFKLVGKYLARRAMEGERPIKQVLLTRSSFLAEKLRVYAHRLIKSLTSDTTPEALRSHEEDPHLDESDDDMAKESAITLSDERFPLVCTFDYFLQVLENTVMAMDRKNFLSSNRLPSSRPYVENHPKGGTARPYHCQRKFIDFHSFKIDYWGKFPKISTKGISVELAFSEIMGVIKGSTTSRESLEPLSFEEYLTRSCRIAPAFVLEAERRRMYAIYELYKTEKENSGESDLVDRVVSLLKTVRGNPPILQLLESTFDEVYIDEVQDQRSIDIELFLTIIKDSRGFHFAGDTAQAISQDATFRFADIKALFHEHFSAAGVTARQHDIAQPKLYTLNKNYRSHQGILAVASLVMAMLWKGFPDTVDKLEPEIGSLLGPKPLFFIGCDSNILVKTNVGLGKLSERTADFGAEQVILVRDAEAKEKLQAEIGDVALVLTILQSKGMEFDDVLLWDFFTGCPSKTGLRSLPALLKNGPLAFDSTIHSGMCNELKHLYVAITRARIQLFFIETSESDVTTVVRMLTQDVPEPLVDVTRQDDTRFEEKLKTLRPGTSVDPWRWSMRGEQLMQEHMFKEAVMCFQKAGDHRNGRLAEGYLREEDGRLCLSVDDTEGFKENLQAAFQHFKDANRVKDAVRCLVRLSRAEDAARLLVENKEYGKAAPLFEQAGLYVEAKDCYHEVGRYSEAIAALRKGSEYDQFVAYLYENRNYIPDVCYRTHCRLCKLLLKQGKISEEHRRDAIKLLGSLAEQEACFLEYQMYGPLASLYSEQSRHNDLFHLLAKTGHLEDALCVAVTSQLWMAAPNISEARIETMLDFVWAGHLLGTPQHESSLASELVGTQCMTRGMLCRIDQWKKGRRLHPWPASQFRQVFSTIDDPVVKLFVSLRALVHSTAIAQASIVQDLPFELVQEVVDLSKSLALQSQSDAWTTTFLLTGLWRADETQDLYIVLPWSPLREALKGVSATDYPRFAKQWILNKIASILLTFETRAREVWNPRWSRRCRYFLTRGFCPVIKRGDACYWLHESITTTGCIRIFQDLLRMNGIFCDLTRLYYCRIMPEKFQKSFLGIKRHWLEQLLREFIYISPFEQDTHAITNTHERLFRSNNPSAIVSCLEELLYFKFKLNKESNEEYSFSSVMEQMQLTKAFGPNVQSRLFKALSDRLPTNAAGRSTQQNLRLLRLLEENMNTQNTISFRNNLRAFIEHFDRVEVFGLQSLHAVTTIAEYLVTYMILKTHGTALVLPQSWIDHHVPTMTTRSLPLEALSLSDLYTFHNCLVELLLCFCRILYRLDQPLMSNFSLSCGRRFYHQSLLQQRNSELLAVAILNLTARPIPPKGSGRVWTVIQEVFSYPSVRAFELQGCPLDKLGHKLASIFANYQGRNALVIVPKSQSQHHMAALQKQPNVKTMTIEYFRSLMLPSIITISSTNPTSNTEAEKTEQYSATEINAIRKIQECWRSWIPRIKQHRLHMQTPEAQVVARFVSLSKQCSANLPTRKLLVSNGVAAQMDVVAKQLALSEQKKTAIACTEDLELPTESYESVDNILHHIGRLENSLKEAARIMSEEHMLRLIGEGNLSNLEDAVREVEGIIRDAEEGTLNVRRMIGDVSRYRG